MLDIVATIQAEQDEIIRAPLDQLLTVQGGPGTGKTAVGLHRAAFLLYNHPALGRDGVLVLGPSRAFLRYIAQVLPALGEEAVVQTTIADIAPKAKVRIQEPMEVRRLKGDPRMGELLQRALYGRRRRSTTMSRSASGSRAARCSKETVNELVATIAARPAPYKAGRLALRSRLVSEARRVFRSSARLGADEAWFEGELIATEEFSSLLDTAVAGRLPRHPRAGPPVVPLPARTLRRRPLLPRRVGLLLRTRDATVTSTAWSVDDLALMDEATFLTGGRTRRYGHIVVDEAQDLTPMQFRMIARRAPSGSITVLGDLAQATGPWTYPDWTDVHAFLPTPPRAPRRADARIPGTRSRARLRLSPPARAAPGVSPTSSIRSGRSDPVIVRCGPDDLAGLARGGPPAGRRARPGGRHRPRGAGPELARLARRHPEIGLLERDAMSRPITVVPAPAAKGLEFDAVVVVEPAAIAGETPGACASSMWR